MNNYAKINIMGQEFIITDWDNPAYFDDIYDTDIDNLKIIVNKDYLLTFLLESLKDKEGAIRLWAISEGVIDEGEKITIEKALSVLKYINEIVSKDTSFSEWLMGKYKDWYDKKIAELGGKSALEEYVNDIISMDIYYEQGGSGGSSGGSSGGGGNSGLWQSIGNVAGNILGNILKNIGKKKRQNQAGTQTPQPSDYYKNKLDLEREKMKMEAEARRRNTMFILVGGLLGFMVLIFTMIMLTKKS